MQVLREGRGHIPGTPAPIQVYETPAAVAYSWPAVERAARTALVEGIGIIPNGEGDVIWALRWDAFDDGPPDVDEVKKLTEGFSDPIVGLSSELLDEPSAFVPPPLAWPLPLDLRLALLERDVRLVHVIDLDQFLEFEHEGSRIVQIRRDRRGRLSNPCFTIESADGMAAASTRFIDDVLYGFVTIASSAEALLSGLGDVDDSDGIEIGQARAGEYGALVNELLSFRRIVS